MLSLNKKNGFSLLGVIVSVFIVAVALVSVLALAAASMRSSSFSKMRLVASGLAQEGIEIVRDMRNSHADWADWYALVNNGDYLVQYDSENLMVFSELPLKINKTSGTYGIYQYDDGEETDFYRKLSLNKEGQKVKITVEVKWQIRDDWHYLFAQDVLYNWQQ